MRGIIKNEGQKWLSFALMATSVLAPFFMISNYLDMEKNPLTNALLIVIPFGCIGCIFFATIGFIVYRQELLRSRKSIAYEAMVIVFCSFISYVLLDVFFKIYVFHF